jgi:parallel beta-helix repeat protein
MHTSSKQHSRAISADVFAIAAAAGKAVNRFCESTIGEWRRSTLLRTLFVFIALALGQSVAGAGPVPLPTSVAVPGPAPATACSGVQIAPGMSADSIQNQINSHAGGTVFCFMSGTYVLNHYITLKDSDQVICTVRRTCVLTGLDQYRGASTAAFGTAHHVIRGFVAEHFIALPNTWPNGALQLRDNGLIDDNEVRFNRIGISASSNQTISNNFIHHNLQYGLSGGPLSNLIIENNDLSANNTGHFDPNNDASGSKIVGSQKGSFFVTWRNNHIYDNYGQGIWSDGNVHGALYEGNLIENNWGAGIDHEISWDATIRNNTLRNNMKFELNLGKSCWHGAQIVVTNSQNLTITGNTVEAVGVNAICLANTTRSEGSVFPQSLANISVANNVVKFRGVVSIGVVGDTPPSGISFSGNTYYIDVPTNRDWNFLGLKTWQQWQAAGQDKLGKLLGW